MSLILTDVRHALRMARKTPGFTLVAVLTLGLGVGAVTSIFSLANGVLLRPLPFDDPDRLVAISEGLPRLDYPVIPFSPPDFDAYTRLNRTMAGVAAYDNRQVELSGVSQPERLVAARVTPNLFPLLGVRPALGRTFTADEGTGQGHVAILSHALWRRAFGADPALLGRTIVIDRVAHEVVGVLPARLEFPPRGEGESWAAFNNQPADVYLPKGFTAEDLRGYGNQFNSSVIGRLRPGVTVDQARAEADGLIRRIEDFYPAEVRTEAKFQLALWVAPLKQAIVGGVRPLILVLFGGVVLLLLVGCANVANLLLARGTTRQREFALRAAMGAGRRRLLAQLLTEGALLGAAGGLLGLLLAMWGTDLLVASLPVSIPRAEAVRVDPVVLAFSLAASLATTLLFGLAPALQFARESRGEALREGARGATAGRRSSRLLGGLVAVQFALALVLAIGGGLLARSLVRLLGTDPGFSPARVLSVSTTLPASSYSEARQVRAFYDELVDRLGRLPGVEAVGGGTSLPMNTTESRMFTVERPVGGADRVSGSTTLSCVNGDYFHALGIRFASGRPFTRAELKPGSPRVVIVNETLARLFFRGHAVGQRIKWGGAQSDAPWMTIVGVVGDVKQGALGSEVIPSIYGPFAQQDDEQVASFFRFMDLAIKVRGVDPMSIVSGVRREVRAMDPSLPIAKVITMERAVTDTVRPQRFYTLLIAAFAGSALLLAAIGLFGVLATAVAQRTQEIGVRVALGASPGSVFQLVLRRGLLYAGLGLVAGALAAAASMRVLGRFLYGISPSDPLTFAAGALLLALVAAAAGYLPARRATRIDPIVALRAE
ncbi:MAG: transporter permease [Acidobacteria bacterium]|nr:transporter permease [Acidobacteriota bacterium]